jgi:ferredoxin-nitrite reductase
VLCACAARSAAAGRARTRREQSHVPPPFLRAGVPSRVCVCCLPRARRRQLTRRRRRPPPAARFPRPQLKLARDPLKYLVHMGEVNALAADAAARGFEALDVDKEAEAELDHRLKWLGLFHKRKHHYGRFMMRLKLPGGFVSGAQLRVLAAAIERYGDDGCADITTRQNIQLRGITLPDVPAVLASFEAVGMSSLQSGLDNVRNAVGNPLAGIDPEEVADSRPATDALHAYVLNHGRGNPEISNLPRKWNVCVVGSHELWEHPHINDLAYLPAERDGVAGYNIIVGGYLSVQRAIESVPMDAWVPAGEPVVSLCHAVLTVFRDYGTRGNRQKCRMMWLVEEMGVERFRAEVAARMPGGTLARAAATDLLRKDWTRRSYLGVHAQKQAGLSWVGCSVPSGRLDAADMAAIGDLADAYGSGEVRLTVEQNFIIADVPNERVAALLAEPLLERFTPFPGRLMAGLVACTGNQFCGFSQIETKQNAWRVAEHLESVLDVPRDVRMMWTGCPNTCGQVQVADIGLMGCMVKAPGGASGMVPGVDVFVGGRVGSDSHLATVTHPSVPMDDLLPLLEGVLVDTFGATRKAVPSPNRALHNRFRLAVKPATKAAPKGTPKKVRRLRSVPRRAVICVPPGCAELTQHCPQLCRLATRRTFAPTAATSTTRPPRWRRSRTTLRAPPAAPPRTASARSTSPAQRTAGALLAEPLGCRNVCSFACVC